MAIFWEVFPQKSLHPFLANLNKLHIQVNVVSFISIPSQYLEVNFPVSC